MRKLSVFNQVSLDGYFVDAGGDMSWAHKQDAEWNEFTSSNAGGGGELVFGRVTYDMMKSFWPTPQAMQSMPEVATQMNALPKVVFSTTLSEAEWNNTKLVKSNIVDEMRRMKNAAGPDMVIMGSGTIVAQFAEEGLIDHYQIVVNPIVLGKGRTMFDGLKDRRNLRLTNTRAFENGNVLLQYAR
jgi:dihydrofolate reductase